MAHRAAQDKTCTVPHAYLLLDKYVPGWASSKPRRAYAKHLVCAYKPALARHSVLAHSALCTYRGIVAERSRS